MDYYIFRHGETYFSKNKIPYGDKIESAEILTEGIPVTKRLADYLKDKGTDKNYSSTFLRCRQTSEIVGQIANKKFIFDERLRDYHVEKESVEDVIKRINDFFDSISVKNCKAVAICTHGYPIAILKELATKGEFEMNNLSSYPQPGILIEIENGVLREIDFN